MAYKKNDKKERKAPKLSSLLFHGSFKRDASN
jgi:hypothetical protein